MSRTPGAVYTELADIANEQYGFLAPEDARERDIDPINLVRMFQRGHLERRATGVYRLRLTPASSLDAYMEAVLWPGPGVRGVLSHETALDLYGLSDVNPAKIDVTLPRAHRIRRAVPRCTESITRIWRTMMSRPSRGIPVVTPARAIRQSAAAHLGLALIGLAIDHAERDGRLTRRAAEELRRELDVERGRGVRR